MNKRDNTNETSALWSVDAIESINFLQNSNIEAFKHGFIGKIGSTYNTSNVYIIWGCVNSGSGSNYIISAGAVFFNGEIYTVDATTFTASNTAVGNIVDVGSGTLILFNDNSTKDILRVRKMVISDAVSGSGTADFANFILLRKNSCFAGFASATISSVGTGGATIGQPGISGTYIVTTDLDGLLNLTNGRFIPKAGLYKVSAQFPFVCNNTCVVSIYLYKNTTPVFIMYTKALSGIENNLQINNFPIIANGTDYYSMVIECGTVSTITMGNFSLAVEPTN